MRSFAARRENRGPENVGTGRAFVVGSGGAAAGRRIQFGALASDASARRSNLDYENVRDPA
jgi:hypothetical protein